MAVTGSEKFAIYHSHHGGEQVVKAGDQAGAEIIASHPEQFGEFLRSEYVK